VNNGPLEFPSETKPALRRGRSGSSSGGSSFSVEPSNESDQKKPALRKGRSSNVSASGSGSLTPKPESVKRKRTDSLSKIPTPEETPIASTNGSASAIKRKRTESFSKVSTEEEPVKEEAVEEVGIPIKVEEEIVVKEEPTEEKRSVKRALKASPIAPRIPGNALLDKPVQILDDHNYLNLTREELVHQPRRSLRTPAKEQETKSAVKRGSRTVKQEPVENSHRTPSPKRKLFSQEEKKVSPRRTTPKKASPRRTTPKKATSPESKRRSSKK